MLGASASCRTTSTSTPHGVVGSNEPLHPSVAAVTLGEVGTDALQPGDDTVERGGVHRLETDRDGVVHRPGLDEQPVGALVIAPRVGAGRRRLARHEPHDVGEHGREGPGVRHLEHQVAEFDLVFHSSSSRNVRSAQ